MTTQHDDNAKRETTHEWAEENACILFDPANEWCEPAIDFAQWKAEDTEGLRSDEEHDTARRHAVLRTEVDLRLAFARHDFDGTDLDALSPAHLAELIVDHFDEVYNGESAEPDSALPITDGEDIPFDAPAAPTAPINPFEKYVLPSSTPLSTADDSELFQQVDDLLRSHFGLPSKPRF